jgi:predicted nucleotidyltransferase
MKFGLSDEHWKIIEKLVLNPFRVHQATVWIFGSRARGDYREFSDLDVLYEASSSLPPGFISRMTENLEESRLPIKVDLVNKSDVAESYKTNIGKDMVLIR